MSYCPIPDKALCIAKLVRQSVRELIPKWGVDGFIFHDNLEGACAIASYTLWRAYAKFDIKSDLVENDDHCWVELQGYVVDLTATQFSLRKDFPKVFMTRAGKYCGHYNYSNPLYRNSEALDQLIHAWWKPQSPISYVADIQKFLDSLSDETLAA